MILDVKVTSVLYCPNGDISIEFGLLRSISICYCLGASALWDILSYKDTCSTPVHATSFSCRKVRAIKILCSLHLKYGIHQGFLSRSEYILDLHLHIHSINVNLCVCVKM